MSSKLKSIKNPVVLIEHDSNQKAIYVNGELKIQSEHIELEQIIDICLENKCNIFKVESDHELTTDGSFPQSFDDFFDIDVRIERDCAA